MCTLTYIPTSEGFIFTHNRDEDKLREPAFAPQKTKINGIEILFPRDSRAGGTWIACNDKFSICLLNGAFEKHKHLPPYRMSRGLVLLDIFSFESLEDFAVEYDLDEIEAFTVVCAENQTNAIAELRWDGVQKHYQNLDKKPTIWSSATLYDSTAREKRKHIFQSFMEKENIINENTILHFHETGETGNTEENLVMERPSGVKTLSISQLVMEGSKTFHYYDRILDTKISIQI